MNEATKSIVSISDMARMVGLSRARFYQLVGTTFPFPVYDVATHRPFYDSGFSERASMSAAATAGSTASR